MMRQFRILKNRAGASLFMNKVVLRWFASYLLIILCVTAVLLISGVNNIRSFTEQIDKYAVSVMENKKQGLDFVFNAVENIALELSFDRDIYRLAMQDKAEVDPDTFFELYELKKRLSGYRVVEGSISDIFVWFANMDYVMGLNAGNSSKNYYNYYYSEYEGNTFDNWKTMMTQKNVGSFFYLKAKNKQESNNRILYLYSVYSSDMSKCIATIGIELSKQEILRSESNGQFFVLDHKNEVLFSNAGEAEEEEIKKYLSGADKQVTHFKTGKDKRAILKSTSDITDLTYVFMTDESEFRNKTEGLHRIIWFYAMLSVVFGTVLAYRMTKRNYKPIEKLVDNVTGRSRLKKPGQTEDAFNYLQDTIADIISENSELRSKNFVKDALFRNTIIVKALKNEMIGDISALEAMERFGMEFQYNCFLVIIYVIDDSSIKDGDETIPAFLVNNMLEEGLGKFYSVMRFEPEHMSGYIINTKQMNETDRVCDIIRVVQDSVQKEFGVSFRAAVSNEYRSVSNLPRCYAEAAECSNYLFLDTEPIIMFRDISGHASTKYHYSIEKEQLLMSCLKAGQAAESKRLINELFEMNLKDAAGSGAIIQCLVYDIVGTLAKLLTEVNDSNLLERLDIFSRINRKSNIKELKKEIFSAIDEFCSLYEQEKDVKGSQTVEKAKEYIDKYYNNPDINCGMIAEQVHISTNYLSTMFKRYTGIGLLEYITEVRMTEAKRLLRTTDLSIEEIMVKIGYLNARSFSRVFLKRTGLQPSKYRELKRNNRKY